MKQGHVEVQSSSMQQLLVAARQPSPLFADHHTQLLLLGGEDKKEKWEQQQFLNQASNTHQKTFQLSSTNNLTLHFSPHPDPDNKCDSNVHVINGVAKKPKRTTQQSTLIKATKEKLGDRIAALHRIVSPFGKTDTASVLLEAIGYIKFLESQIESQTQPYLASVVHKDICEEEAKELSSRGLCLVPISCTLHVGNDKNGADDCWAPAFGANLG